MRDVLRTVSRAPGGRRLVVAVAGIAGLLTLTPACGQVADPVPASMPAPSPSLAPMSVPDPADDVTNGLGDLAAEDALVLARDALAEAASFRVAGSPAPGQMLDLVFVAGTPTAGGEPPSRTDAPEAAASARGVRGEVTRDGSTFSLLVADGDVYVRGDLDWLADAIDSEARDTLGGKWLLLPASLAQGLETLGSPGSFADSLLDAAGPVRSVGVSLIDGTPAVGVRWVESEATVWLSGKGEPYPILVERLGATAEQGVLRFSDVDEPVTLAAPEAADVVVAPEPSDE